MNNSAKLPFYAKASLILIGIYVFVLMLYIAQGIIVPLIFGGIIAIVLHPIVRYLVYKGMNRIIAIIITLLLFFVIVAGFTLFIISQFGMFSETWPLLVEKITNIINTTIDWIPGYFNISAEKVNTWITETKTDLFNSSSSVIGKTILTVGNALIAIFLVPVYIFLMLYYQPLLLDFIHQLFADNRQSKVTIIVTKTKTVVQSYLVGLFIETILVAILNSVGLLILGIEYAILIGVLGALLNLIPYIGGLIAVAMPMTIALVTKESAWFALYVLGVYYFIQLVDNNYIVPKIVASKVKINALVSIVAVLAGGALWGVAGMFLSIPLIAIIKVICDNIDPLKPVGLLLGDTMPEITVFKKKSKKIKPIVDSENGK